MVTNKPSLSEDFCPADIRAQMERILASAHFKSSKRLQRFLTFIVEETLAGRSDATKERLLGIEVFDREPGYDLADDPIVRVTAGDLRKRLAQYYVETGHSTEIRIELHAGSYVPQFHHPPQIGSPKPKLPEPAPEALPLPQSPHLALKRRRRYTSIVAAGFCLVAIATSAFLLRNRQPPLERFWEPVLGAEGPILIAVPDIGTRLKVDAPSGDSSRFTGIKGSNLLALADVLTFGQVAAFLGERHRPFLLESAPYVSFGEIRLHPSVLIGGRGNPWSIDSMDSLRYRLVVITDTKVGIRDVTNPSTLSWTVDFGSGVQSIPREFAIVSRYYDPKAGQTRVLIVGLGANGTTAGAEFVTVPDCFRQFAEQAPRGWENKNIEVVLETQLVKGESGRPHILAAHVW
jgi:hypothetical protein